MPTGGTDVKVYYLVIVLDLPSVCRTQYFVCQVTLRSYFFLIVSISLRIIYCIPSDLLE